MEHALASLLQLASFDHAKCDALLLQRHIQIPNAFSPNKGAYERNSVYVGLWVVGVWEASVVFLGVRAWLKKPPPTDRWLIWRFASPVFATLGLVGLLAQLQGDVDYVDACNGLLHRATTTPPASHFFNDAISACSVFAGFLLLLGGYLSWRFAHVVADAAIETYDGRNRIMQAIARAVTFGTANDYGAQITNARFVGVVAGIMGTAMLYGFASDYFKH